MTQPTVTLSSDEAEPTGICNGISISLRLVLVAADLGLRGALDVRSDATAAIGACRRRSLGIIRHLATTDRWIQDKLRTGDVSLEKALGSGNPSGVLTKHVDKQLLDRHIASLGLIVQDGRADSVPDIDIGWLLDRSDMPFIFLLLTASPSLLSNEEC